MTLRINWVLDTINKSQRHILQLAFYQHKFSYPLVSLRQQRLGLIFGQHCQLHSNYSEVFLDGSLQDFSQMPPHCIGLDDKDGVKRTRTCGGNGKNCQLKSSKTKQFFLSSYNDQANWVWCWKFFHIQIPLTIVRVHWGYSNRSYHAMQ